MRVTVEQIEQAFDKYKDDFEKSLPKPSFGLIHTYRTSGEFTCIKWKNGTVRRPKISITDYFDWDQETIDIVVIHEMIHYYIAYYKIKDNEEHGEKFKELGNVFKEKYGLEIYDLMPAERIQKRREGAPKLAWILAKLFG